MARVTKRNVDAVEADGAKPAFLWDDALRGFGVKALPSGAKKYIVKYRTNGGGRNATQRWLNLGSHGQLTAEQARQLAQQALAAIARGEDPQAAKVLARNAMTFADLWQRFATQHLSMRKPKTRYDYEGLWRDVLQPRMGAMVVDRISFSDVDRLHKSMSKVPYRANRALALISSLFTLAEMWEIRPASSNPCKHVARFKEIPRNRFLNGEELRGLGQAMREMEVSGELSPSAANAVRLLLLTGARLNEILAAEWQWVDRARSILTLPGAKTIYLSEASLLVISAQFELSGVGQYLFPGSGLGGRMINLRKPWTRICERAGLVGVRLHDLRHTAASVAVGQGESLPVIGRLLGHSQAQTTQRYAHVDANPALRAANAIGQVMALALGVES